MTEEESSGANLSIMSLGLAIAAVPFGLVRFGFSFSLLSQVVLTVYGLTVLIGGAYRDSGEMGFFVDMAAIAGLILPFLGPPLGYPIGTSTWLWTIIGLTVLLALPSTALVLVTSSE